MNSFDFLLISRTDTFMAKSYNQYRLWKQTVGLMADGQIPWQWNLNDAVKLKLLFHFLEQNYIFSPRNKRKWSDLK